MTRGRVSFLVTFPVLLALILLPAWAFQSQAPANSSELGPIIQYTGQTCRSSTLPPDPTAPDLGCAAPPNTFDASAYTATSASAATMAQAGPVFDAWAWASFAAFNWPAKLDITKPSGVLRGVPDVVRSEFKTASPQAVLVWETFKEKREVFNNNVKPNQWQPLTYPPDQSIILEGGSVPPCSLQDRTAAAALPGGAHRRILQSSKIPLPFVPHRLDETAEVASPAQESQAALCAGYSGAALTACQNAFPPPAPNATQVAFGPTMINPRPPVGPRVFAPPPVVGPVDPAGPTSDFVYYEVRVNYDYFDYVTANKLNFVNPPSPVPAGTGTPSIQPPYSLPWRTSAGAPPSSAQQRNSVAGYDAATTAASYTLMPSTPRKIGSVQVKSAWRKLPRPDPNYHTTTAVYFKTNANNKPCFAVSTFGMIGLHIIQRVHMGPKPPTSPPPNTATTATVPPPPAQPLGGTFIFATWEHKSIGDGAGYSYVNFMTAGGEEQQNPMPYPALANAIPVRRQKPYPLASTQQVNAAAHSLLPANSVWRNYHLIGTQFLTVNANTAQNLTAEQVSLQYNQPYYLANLVVETNLGLQNFQGLPPNVNVIGQYSGFTNTSTAYDPNVPNVSFNGSPYNMGGCMGCHGVAQLLGSNFSFVLLDGQRGARIDTATTVSIPPRPPSPPTTTSNPPGR